MKNKLHYKVMLSALIIISSVFIKLCNIDSNAASNFTLTKKKIRFTLEEDELLKKLVEEYGMGKWAEIAEHMPNRNRRQCRERYINNLSPNINKHPWTKEEDELLMKMQGEHGNRWVMMTKFFPGRSELQLSNRYRGLLRRMPLNDL